jgi:putative transposase
MNRRESPIWGGSLYATRWAYRDTLQTQGITRSLSRKGDCWDNAVMESFFGTLKTELILSSLLVDPPGSSISHP